MSKRSFWVLTLLLSAFIGSYIGIQKDFGLGWDEPENLGVGEKYLHYYLTGHLDFSDDVPTVQGHPNLYYRYVKDKPYILWPFANTVSALTCKIFNQELHWMDWLSAHRVATLLFTISLLGSVFAFVTRYWGLQQGIFCFLTIATYPSFFGQSFNNIKDIPETALFSITIMSFAHWILSGDSPFFYVAFFFWGLALATKMDAVLIPIIMLSWLAIGRSANAKWSREMYPRLIHRVVAGLSITTGTVFILFPPFHPWLYQNLKGLILGASTFARDMAAYTFEIGTSPLISWNLYAPRQLLYATPTPSIFFFLAGVVGILAGIRRDERMRSLLFLWLAVPVLRHCFPMSNHYDGIRHLMAFIVPFGILVSLGIQTASETIARYLPVKKSYASAACGAALLVPNLRALIVMHPYQMSYFNALAGGLGGAQERRIEWSSDYWLNSYKEAGEWLNVNAREGANLMVHPAPDFFSSFYLKRMDLKLLPSTIFPDIPADTYAVIAPTYMDQSVETALKQNSLKVVFRIQRERGDLLTIYYKGAARTGS